VTVPTQGAGARARSGLGSLLSLETLIAIYASWTVGYWVALGAGRGWATAIPVALVVGAFVAALRWRWPDGREEPVRDHLGPMLLVLSLVILWPVLFDLGRGLLAVAVAALLATRAGLLLVRGDFDRRDAQLVITVFVAALLTVAFQLNWAIVVVLLGLGSLVVIAKPGLVDRLHVPVFGSANATDRRSHLGNRALAFLVLAVLGSMIAIWHAGAASFWNPDNTYYLNKAEHYADAAATFEVRDYMYGVENVTHIPLGNILSSYEPLVGVAAALTGRSAFDVMFCGVVPLVMFLIPFAARYGARGVGFGRADLVGALAAAAILLTTATATTTLYATASLGKRIGQLVFMPILFGAYGRLFREPSPGRALVATLAAVCGVGVSPSLGIAASIVAAAFAGAAAWETWRKRAAVPSTPARLLTLSVPFLFLAGFSLFAWAFQQRGGTAQLSGGYRHFDEPRQAWELAFGPTRDSPLAVFFVLGALGTALLVRAPARIRRVMALLIFALFALLFGPWTFDFFIDDVLGLNHFAWRFFWALPGAWFVGVALASADQRRRLGLLTLAAAVLGLGISGPRIRYMGAESLRSEHATVWKAPRAWPSEAGADAALQRAARATLEATPAGGRYLAPARVEELATGLQVARFPTYARLFYVMVAKNDPRVPTDFFAGERLLLGTGMAGGTPAGADATAWRNALRAVEVDTVCLDDRAAVGLRRAVIDAYQPFGSAGLCELWTR
jgi:hypothetical protein